jgi:hypothetical protein
MYKKPELSAQARILSSQVKSRFGVTLTHQAALTVIARMNGYKDWHTCAKDLVTVPTLTVTDIRAKAIQHVMGLAFRQLGCWAGKEEELLSALRDAVSEQDWHLADKKCLALFDSGELKQNNEDYALQLKDLVPCIERQVQATEQMLRRLSGGSEEDVILNETVQDWRISQGESPDSLLEEDLQPFELRLSRSQAQFYVDIAVPHTGPSDTEGKPGLSLFIEINEGKPCVHVSSDIYGDALLSIFGVGDGLVVRNNSPQAIEPAGEHAFGTRVQGHWLIK